MTLYKYNKLKHLTNTLQVGVPVTSKELLEQGVSAQLAHHYAKAGWLHRVARGVYVRPGEGMQLLPALRTLERLGYDFHVGGRSALDLLGVRHNLRFSQTTVLYTTKAFALPRWLTERHKLEARQKRLFKATAERLGISRLADDPNNPWVSERERAVLEMLSEVPHQQSLEEARHLVEMLQTLRSSLMEELLEACTRVKVVRLFLMLAKEANLAVLAKLQESNLPTGSHSRWVSKSRSGLLVLKP